MNFKHHHHHLRDYLLPIIIHSSVNFVWKSFFHLIILPTGIFDYSILSYYSCLAWYISQCVADLNQRVGLGVTTTTTTLCHQFVVVTSSLVRQLHWLTNKATRALTTSKRRHSQIHESFENSQNVSCISVYKWRDKKLSYCWETVRCESMPRIAVMHVEMTT